MVTEHQSHHHHLDDGTVVHHSHRESLGPDHFIVVVYVEPDTNAHARSGQDHPIVECGCDNWGVA